MAIAASFPCDILSIVGIVAPPESCRWARTQGVEHRPSRGDLARWNLGGTGDGDCGAETVNAPTLGSSKCPDPKCPLPKGLNATLPLDVEGKEVIANAQCCSFGHQ